MAEMKWGFLYPFEPFLRGRPCGLPRWWGSCQSPGPAWGRGAGRARCPETPWVSLGRASWPRKVEDTGGHTAPPPRPRAPTPGSCSAARSSGARPGPCSVDIYLFYVDMIDIVDTIDTHPGPREGRHGLEVEYQQSGPGVGDRGVMGPETSGTCSMEAYIYCNLVCCHWTIITMHCCWKTTRCKNNRAPFHCRTKK